MNKFDDFLKSTVGQLTFITGAILLCGTMFYFLFFKGKQQENITTKDKAETNIDVQDTIFKKRKNVYYESGKKKEGNIDPEKNFYHFNDRVKEINNAVDSIETSTSPKKEIDYKKMVDSLLALQNAKKQTSNKRNTYSSKKQYSTTPKRKVTPEENEMSEYKRLVEMKELMLKNSQDYVRSSPATTNSKENVNASNLIETRASFYKNQFVMPGDRVKMILTNDIVINGNMFEKNTPIFAMVTINRSRVLLDIDNINGVPVDLVVKDINDQMEGVYSKRADELWEQYKEDQNNTNINEAASEISSGSRIVNSSIQALGNFFKRKKLRDNEKILLINDHEVLLTNKL